MSDRNMNRSHYSETPVKEALFYVAAGRSARVEKRSVCMRKHGGITLARGASQSEHVQGFSRLFQTSFQAGILSIWKVGENACKRPRAARVCLQGFSRFFQTFVWREGIVSRVCALRGRPCARSGVSRAAESWLAQAGSSDPARRQRSSMDADALASEQAALQLPAPSHDALSLHSRSLEVLPNDGADALGPVRTMP